MSQGAYQKSELTSRTSHFECEFLLKTCLPCTPFRNGLIWLDSVQQNSSGHKVLTNGMHPQIIKVFLPSKKILFTSEIPAIWTKDLLSFWGTRSPLQIHSDKAPALIHVTSSSECHYNHGLYNLEQVLNFISHVEKSLNSVKILEKYLLSLLGLESP